jgi:hypothetical protein
MAASTVRSGEPMRTPDFTSDGWCLEDGEERHREAPSTFEIPDLAARKALQAGDFAKLIFRIGTVEKDKSGFVERMWVIVRERTADGYVGMLANVPRTIDGNDYLRLKSELPFESRHVIDCDDATVESKADARWPPLRTWRRD